MYRKFKIITNLWWIVRIAKLGRQVKSEVFVIRNHVVTDFYDFLSTLLECLLQK